MSFSKLDKILKSLSLHAAFKMIKNPSSNFVIIKSSLNPVDHPQGGGEGRSKGGQARTRKGTMSKGLKTRSKKKKSSRLILERKRK